MCIRSNESSNFTSVSLIRKIERPASEHFSVLHFCGLILYTDILRAPRQEEQAARSSSDEQGRGGKILVSLSNTLRTRPPRLFQLVWLNEHNAWIPLMNVRISSIYCLPGMTGSKDDYRNQFTGSLAKTKNSHRFFHTFRHGLKVRFFIMVSHK